MAAVRAAAEQEQKPEAVRRAQNDLDELRTLRDEHTHAKQDEDELDFQRLKSHQDDGRVSPD